MENNTLTARQAFTCKTVLFVAGIICLLSMISSCSKPVPDTGQISSYTDIYGEDSDYNINPPGYTKLDAFGTELDDAAVEWVVVRDDVTGLIWEIKTNDGGIHDKDTTYSWQDGQDVFILQINADKFAGYSDWRLPTITELSTIVHRDRFTPSIDTAHFPNTKSYGYWSATPFEVEEAWVVDFYFGSIHYSDRTKGCCVRAVRGSWFGSKLVDNGDGTVSDKATGLMWQQGEAGAMTWYSALSYCESLELAGFDDWRLPNINELITILDYTAFNPAVDTTVFPVVDKRTHWSSTSYAQTAGNAWLLDFHDGIVIDFTKDFELPVRAVRGLQ